MRSPKWSKLALLMAALAVAGGCSAYGAQEDDVVRVYSGRHYGVESAFERFGKDTGIDVEFLFGSDADLRERLKTEGEDTLADVYLTVDASNLALAARSGLLAPLDSPALEETVPAHLQDPENRWFAVALRARTIIYNPEKVDPSELSTYAGLADPRWKGRLCLRNSTATYTQSLVASLIAHDGYEGAKAIVKGWVDNDPEMINSDPEIVRTVSKEGCDVAVVNHYYLADEMKKNPGLDARIFWADQDRHGTHVNISGAGVTKHADDPGLAQRFIEWLATDGQGIFVSTSQEFPVNPAVAPGELLQSFGTFKADELDASRIGDLNADATRLMDEVGYQ